MLSTLLFVSLAAATTTAVTATDGPTLSTDVWSDFHQFLVRFRSKQHAYTSFEEFQHRFEVFRDNWHAIREHNAAATQTKPFTLGINAFSDLTLDEFRRTYAQAGYKKKQKEQNEQTEQKEQNLRGSNGVDVGYGCKSFEYKESNDTLPASVDWREKGAVTSVKNQGQCGSCWTFSSTGAVEGALAVATGKLVDLSEQELVDCATGFWYGSHGCNGGQMEGAFKYVIQHGQCLDKDYPYVSGDTKTNGKCEQSLCASAATMKQCWDVKPNDQVSLMAAVAKRPVAVAIEADTKYFQSYSGGVLTADACGTTLDHGVLVVGYGEETGIPYFLVKNSWGGDWGENGYVKIARSGLRDDAGVCGIAMDPSFIEA